MHLLAATPGAINDGQEPVDLGQTPADIVVISAADTELAALSEARAQMQTPPALRLAKSRGCWGVRAIGNTVSHNTRHACTRRG